MKKKVSVVIPSYNENKINILVKKIKDYRKKNPNVSFLIVDDGCSKLKQMHEEINAAKIPLIINSVNRGKGYSVCKGMLDVLKNQSAAYFVFMDADLSVSLDQIQNSYDALEKGADVVIGSRSHSDSEIVVYQKSKRKSAGKVFNYLCQLLILKGVKDTQCGFKAFKKHAAQTIFEAQQITDFSFDVELLVLAHRQHYKLSIIPVRWINDENTSVRFFRDGFRMFCSLIKIKWMYNILRPLHYDENNNVNH